MGSHMPTKYSLNRRGSTLFPLGLCLSHTPVEDEPQKLAVWRNFQPFVEWASTNPMYLWNQSAKYLGNYNGIQLANKARFKSKIIAIGRLLLLLILLPVVSLF
jgi:hypothetical protein